MESLSLPNRIGRGKNAPVNLAKVAVRYRGALHGGITQVEIRNLAHRQGQTFRQYKRVEFKLFPIYPTSRIACLVVDNMQGAIRFLIHPVYPASQDQAGTNLCLDHFLHHDWLGAHILVVNKCPELSQRLFRPSEFVIFVSEAEAIPLPVFPQQVLRVSCGPESNGLKRQEFFEGGMYVVSHGEVWSWLAVLVAKLVDMKELIALAALLEDRYTAGRKVQDYKLTHSQSRIAESYNYRQQGQLGALAVHTSITFLSFMLNLFYPYYLYD